MSVRCNTLGAYGSLLLQLGLDISVNSFSTDSNKKKLFCAPLKDERKLTIH